MKKLFIIFATAVIFFTVIMMATSINKVPEITKVEGQLPESQQDRASSMWDQVPESDVLQDLIFAKYGIPADQLVISSPNGRERVQYARIILAQEVENENVEVPYYYFEYKPKSKPPWKEVTKENLPEKINEVFTNGE